LQTFIAFSGNIAKRKEVYMMKAEIEINIAILTERMEQNKKIIDENQEFLRKIIRQPGSSQRSEMFIQHFRENLELHSQNRHFLKLQFELKRALSPYYKLKTFGAMSLT
jgi:hypothetical protein